MTTRPRHHGFTLIEAIAAIVVLAIATPVALALLGDAARARVDAIQTARAVWLASAALETCIADASSDAPGLGFDAMGGGQSYIQNARSRIDDDYGDFYATYGLTYEIAIVPVVVTQGGQGWNAQEAPGMPDPDYRRIRITVQWKDAKGGDRSMDVDAIVADL